MSIGIPLQGICVLVRLGAVKEIINDFTIRVATVNGSGSQSANLVLLRGLFEMGIPVSGKNIFPSNIAGLPTWYNIRINEKGYTANPDCYDVLILMNQDTFVQDIQEAHPGSVILYNDKLTGPAPREDLVFYPMPFQKMVAQCCEAVTLRKMVINMLYVGAAAALLDIDMGCIHKALEKQFDKKQKAIELNWKAVQSAYDYTKTQIQKKDPYRVRRLDLTRGKIVITGNDAAALGCLFGGCTVFSWYPITPASSLGEAAMDYFSRFRKDPVSGQAKFAIIQAEDELAAIGMALGAGWAGARAATCTSGPGISLMAEFAGLGYFAELPAVIFNIQRLGPSTGLPTRTSQGDILFTHFLSHGDTQHLAVIPSDVKECFEMAIEAFNLAEEFQTPVFYLSDLDLGMNNWMSDPFEYPSTPFRRGKVLGREDLDRLATGTGFKRYEDVDGDGLCYRTLPGTPHPKAAYFTRGSGHNEAAAYTEDNRAWKRVLDRIAKKIRRAGDKVPQPIVHRVGGAKIGIIAYGSTHPAVLEAREQLQAKGVPTHYLRIRGLPLNGMVENFLKECESLYVVEQNQQGQMASLIKMHSPKYAGKIRSMLHYDGMPIGSATIVSQIGGLTGKEEMPKKIEIVSSE